MPDNERFSPHQDEDSPFLRFVGIEDVGSEDGVGSVSIKVERHHLQAAGSVHGGLLSVLADTACYRAVRSVLLPGQRTTTVELKLNFMEATNSGRLTATASVIGNTGSLLAVDVGVSSDEGRLVAQGLSTYLVFESE